MHIVGLRRLTIAPLLSDSETELKYGAPMRLARTAISAAYGPEAKGSEYFNTRGELVRLGGGKQGDMSIRFAEANEDALALILGARIDANGVIVSGGRRDRPFSSDGNSRSLPYFALGYEAFAIEGADVESAMHEAEDGDSRRAGAYEKTWLYKCRARLGQYARAGAGATPKSAHIELIVTPLFTRRRFAGDSLFTARLSPGAASAGTGWLDEVYIPEERIWTN